MPLVQSVTINKTSTHKMVQSKKTQESVAYFNPLEQRIRNIQDSMSSKYFNPLDHGEVVEYVKNYILLNSKVDTTSIPSHEFRELVMLGVEDFLSKNKDNILYTHLNVITSEASLSKTVFFPENFAFENASLSQNLQGNALKASSNVTSKKNVNNSLQWRTQNTSGHSNNCGIFSMFPSISSSEAQKIRNNLVNLVQEQHQNNQLTDVDYSSMQMNLTSPKFGMTYSQVFDEYMGGMKRGGFLDPFALQKIASMHGKHLVILSPNSPSDCGKSLKEIYLNNRISKPFQQVVFIKHNGSNHFESVVSIRPS